MSQQASGGADSGAPQSAARSGAQLRRPHNAKLLLCPSCRQTFRREVDLQWYYRQVGILFGWPLATCPSCLAREEYAARARLAAQQEQQRLAAERADAAQADAAQADAAQAAAEGKGKAKGKGKGKAKGKAPQKGG